jgi:hypothetical protein
MGKEPRVALLLLSASSLLALMVDFVVGELKHRH